MDILLIAHSHWRNIVFLATALVLVKYTLSWLMKSKFGKLDRILGIVLTSSADIQTLMGLVLFTMMTIEVGFDRLRMEHAITNLIGVGLLHLAAKWRTAEDSIRFRNTLFMTLGFIVFIMIGISRLPAGLSVLLGK
ncbi:MAG: hypothetical protein IPK11_05265 [Ignavibacteria bacterium]|jgi:hypothetical protein|nr:hypothetical protein [Ignavibacteria bacterium]HRI30120.1 hypothetical protein [Candidatus Kapabacteria bacterium]